jgi:4-hydroxybenzoate polyprenyltransferase
LLEIQSSFPSLHSVEIRSVIATSEVKGGPVSRFLRLIRFSHTIFALPFALGALVVAANGLPSLRTLLLVVLCMIFARTAAMLFNRLVDWSLDQRNPRTAARHLLVSKSAAVIWLVVSSAGFVVAAAAINRLTLLLAPVALAIVFIYSITKRFTSATHFFLGLALAIAPIGAWIAQTGSIAVPPLVLAAGVICWVAGFDLIYATQDYDFDRREGIRSLVVKLGVARSLRLAQLLHLLTFVALFAFGVVARLGALYFWSMPLIAAALFYEHKTEKLDLTGINRAFFQSNAFVSAVFLVAVCVDRLIR